MEIRKATPEELLDLIVAWQKSGYRVTAWSKKGWWSTLWCATLIGPDEQDSVLERIEKLLKGA